MPEFSFEKPKWMKELNKPKPKPEPEPEPTLETEIEDASVKMKRLFDAYSRSYEKNRQPTTSKPQEPPVLVIKEKFCKKCGKELIWERDSLEGFDPYTGLLSFDEFLTCPDAVGHIASMHDVRLYTRNLQKNTVFKGTVRADFGQQYGTSIAMTSSGYSHPLIHRWTDTK